MSSGPSSVEAYVSGETSSARAAETAGRDVDEQEAGRRRRRPPTRARRAVRAAAGRPGQEQGRRHQRDGARR